MRPAARSLARAARATTLNRLAAGQVRMASTLLKMPAMSPTMTEGGLAAWKVKEGDSFSAGDVLLEIETDKATIDVEAQEDGVVGKIMVEAGKKGVPVGEVIAVLAEEGDDLSKLEIPGDTSAHAEPVPKEDEVAAKEKEEDKGDKEAAPSGSDTAKPVHRELDASKPMFPSVSRLLIGSDLSEEAIAKIKPTGRHGMLTKGDVLAALGVIKNAYGSAEKLFTDPMLPGGRRASEPKITGSKSAAPAAPEKPLTGPEIRRLIVKGMSKATAPRPQAADVAATARITDAEFDAILGDYATLLPPPPASAAPAPAAPAPKADEYAGLF